MILISFKQHVFGFFAGSTMSNVTNSPYPTYEVNIVAPIVLASLIVISLIAWFVQSILLHCRTFGLVIFLHISHLTIITGLVLRILYSRGVSNMSAIFTASTILLAIGQRIIILANYVFVLEVTDSKAGLNNAVVNGALLFYVASIVLLGVADSILSNGDGSNTSFPLRQASSALVLCLTVLFYPFWFVTKTVHDMKKQAIVLLAISSLTCLIFTVYLMVTSISGYYFRVNQEEFWFYIFQLVPSIIALFTWTILHPKRSLKASQQSPYPVSQGSRLSSPESIHMDSGIVTDAWE